MSHHILVAIDGSRDSDRALEQAIDLAHRQQARLTLITIVESGAWADLLAPGASADNVAAGALAQAMMTMHRAADGVPAGVEVTTLVRYPPIRQALVRQIEDSRPDLVLIGARGRGDARSTMLGSVSDYVLRHSPVAVRIAKADRESTAPAPLPYRRLERTSVVGARTRFETQIRLVSARQRELRYADQRRETPLTRRWQIAREPPLSPPTLGGNDDRRR